MPQPAPRRLSHDVARYLPSLAIPIAVATVSTVVYARVTTPAVLGAFLLATALAASVGTPCGEWLTQSVLRFYPVYAREDRLNAFLQTVLVLALTSGAVAAVAVAALLWLGFGMSEFRSLDHLMPAVALTFFSVSATGRGAILQARFEVTRYSILNSIVAVARFACPLALLRLIEPLSALLWGTALSAIVGWILLMRAGSGEASGPSLRRQEFGEMARSVAGFGVPMSVSGIGVQVLQYSDRFAIAAILGASAVGLYSTNYSIAEKLLILVQGALIYAAHPPIMAAWERGDFSEAQSIIRTSMRWLLLLGAPIIAFTAVRSELISAFLLGDAYAPGHIVIPVTAASVLIYAASQYGHKCFELSRDTWMITAALLAAAVVNAAAAVSFTIAFGYFGGAVATGAGYATYAVLIFFLSRRRGIFSWRIPWRTFGIAALGSALAAGMWLVFVPVRLQQIADGVSLIVGGALGLALYGLVVFVSGELRLPRTLLTRVRLLGRSA